MALSAHKGAEPSRSRRSIRSSPITCAARRRTETSRCPRRRSPTSRRATSRSRPAAQPETNVRRPASSSSTRCSGAAWWAAATPAAAERARLRQQSVLDVVQRRRDPLERPARHAGQAAHRSVLHRDLRGGAADHDDAADDVHGADAARDATATGTSRRRLFIDLTVLAMACDLTRVVTIQYSDSWGVNYPDYALGNGHRGARHLERPLHLAQARRHRSRDGPRRPRPHGGDAHRRRCASFKRRASRCAASRTW